MKKIKSLIGLVVLSATMLFTACDLLNGENQTVIPQVGTIEGKAIYSNSQDSSGIFVTLDKTDGLRTATILNSVEQGVLPDASRNVVAYTTVGNDGFFRFANLEKGLYTVYASSNDSSEKAVAMNIEVKAGDTVTLETLQLTATGSISGKITVDNTATNDSFI